MAYELIETATLASASSSIEFASIPQDGIDLLLLCSLRDSTTATTAGIRINNVDDTLDYKYVQLFGNGVSASAAQLNFSQFLITNNPSNWTANTFTNHEIRITNYTTSTNKAVSFDMVSENNGTDAHQRLSAGTHTIAAPVSVLQLFTSGTFVAGTTVSLYKIY